MGAAWAIGEGAPAKYVSASFHPSLVPDTIVTRAPTRIDFGGGWTDVPPYSDEVGGFVCNLAISRYATVSIIRGSRPAASGQECFADRSIADAVARRFCLTDAWISTRSDFPVGAGLGGSSAVGVAAVAALAASRGDTMTPGAIAELSRDIEISDLGIAGGRQDHYAAAFGGALGLRFSARGVDVSRIPMPARVRSEIERRCIVVHTGQSRISGDTIAAVLHAYREGERGVLCALARMRELAEQMADALAAGNIDDLANLVGEQWVHQRSLHPAIPTPLIDEMIERASSAGALGSKALGASGGGCVLAIAGADRVEQVRAAIEPLGDVLSFNVVNEGVELCA